MNTLETIYKTCLKTLKTVQIIQELRTLLLLCVCGGGGGGIRRGGSIAKVIPIYPTKFLDDLYGAACQTNRCFRTAPTCCGVKDKNYFRVRTNSKWTLARQRKIYKRGNLTLTLFPSIQSHLFDFSNVLPLHNYALMKEYFHSRNQERVHYMGRSRETNSHIRTIHFTESSMTKQQKDMDKKSQCRLNKSRCPN